MAQQGASMQSYNNELVKGIEDLKERRGKAQQQILVEEEKKRELESQISVLTEKLNAVESNLAVLYSKRKDYDATIGETESVYIKILESSQTLLHVLKRESTNLARKEQEVSREDVDN